VGNGNDYDTGRQLSEHDAKRKSPDRTLAMLIVDHREARWMFDDGSNRRVNYRDEPQGGITTPLGVPDEGFVKVPPRLGMIFSSHLWPVSSPAVEEQPL